ncbi:TPA: transporter substrate-binding domain-containing protein, partial [Vibrio alginolyticus]|nr:transporter substrate-binding domain-containing protein [Vibrio alginolyticus]
MNRFKRSVSITLAFFCFNALSYEISSTVTFKKYSLEEIRNDFENNFDGYKPDTLRVGFVRNNFSPYDTELITMKKYYEGISADYLKLIELSTGIKINIVPFSSRNNAIEALKDEKIDLLTTSNIYESFNGLKLSIPYKEDIPALFSLNVNREKYSNSVESVGLIREYLPSKEIRRVFPSSNIILYRTPQELISALLTRKIDVMVMDLYSANYQINREFSGAINFVKLIDIESNGFSFSSNNENFINIINFIIKRVDKNLAYRLSNFWNGGGLSIPDKASLISARKQAKNLRESSEVNVVLSKYSAPISYLDKENIPRGIVIDILEAFRVITGIKLNYIFVDNEYEQIRFLNEDKADLSVLPINLIKEGYGKNVRVFNRFLAKSVYVKISRINSKNNEFNIIVYPKSKKINEFLTKEYPDKVLIEQDDYLQVLNKLEEISSDAIAIAPLITSNFYIDTYFKNRLKIDEIFSKIEPEVFHFSINKNKEDLINLNKEIFDVVTIEDMNLISNRWQKNAYPSQQTWKDFKYTIYSVIFLGGIIVILVLTGGYSIFKSYKNTLKVKDKLRNQLAFLQILIDKIPHPIYVLDQNLNLLLYNKSYFDLINEKYLDDKNIDKLARVFDNEYNDALSKNKP